MSGNYRDGAEVMNCEALGVVGGLFLVLIGIGLITFCIFYPHYYVTKKIKKECEGYSWYGTEWRDGYVWTLVEDKIRKQHELMLGHLNTKQDIKPKKEKK